MLLRAGAGLAALACVLWVLTDQERGGRSSSSPATLAVASERASLPLAGPRVEEESKRRALLENGPESGGEPAVEIPRTTLSGRLQVDGFAPYKGRVRIQSADGTWDHSAAIDPYGRFLVENVPVVELALAFEAESLAERPLLLPNHYELTPAPGRIQFVDLDWTSRHLNVQVVSEPPGRAKVDIQGPNYRASFDTNERGKARLSLVGNGSFSLRAELSSGLSGVADVELEEGDELETVVIAAH